MKGFESPTDNVDTNGLETRKRTQEESDEGEFVVDEEGFVSLEDALKQIKEEGNGEILDDAA